MDKKSILLSIHVFNRLCVLVLGLGMLSCDYSGDEPRIEGKHSKSFDYKAQTKVFRVVVYGGKSYNHKVDWYINGIFKGEELLTNRVDTLPNGDMTIAYDWVTFTVPRHKSFITVTVSENNTGQTRSVLFGADNSRKNIFAPDFTVIQHPK